MKYLLLTILTLAFFSCGENTTNLNSGIKNLNNESLKQFVPHQAFTNNSTVVFNNKEGIEKKLNIETSEFIEDLNIEDLQYQREVVIYSLSEANNNDYKINIQLSGHYYDLNTPIGIVDCSLLTQVNGGWVPTIKLNEKGDIRIGSREDKTFGDKEFTDVFSSVEIINSNYKYSKIYYNYEFGIVAFHDHQNELWFFNRFEE